MIRKSFRSLGTRLLPPANPSKLVAILLLAILAGCGGSASKSTPDQRIQAGGFAFRAPAGWEVKRTFRIVAARQGDALVSVTIFRLSRPFRRELWQQIVPQLDRVAQQLASREDAKVARSRTVTLNGHDVRTYDLRRPNGTTERIGFVLFGRREFQLYCRGDDAACSLLFSSFRLLAA
jgi:hypothetical protein